MGHGLRPQVLQNLELLNKITLSRISVDLQLNVDELIKQRLLLLKKRHLSRVELSASILLIHAVTGSCSNSPISIIPNNTGLKENIMHETIQPIAPTVITPEVALSGLTGKATSSIV
ncbi:hypothetical protein ACOSQ3_025057 [Xanthoceras sorbifolium]